MELSLSTEPGFPVLEGPPAGPLIARPSDAAALVAACLGEGARAALLYAPNLPPRFFDLSSGEAGELLQKLQNYRIRLAVVCPPGSVTFSARFAELLAEARHGRDFGVFERRDEAIGWLAR